MLCVVNYLDINNIKLTNRVTIFLPKYYETTWVIVYSDFLATLISWKFWFLSKLEQNKHIRIWDDSWHRWSFEMSILSKKILSKNCASESFNQCAQKWWCCDKTGSTFKYWKWRKCITNRYQLSIETIVAAWRHHFSPLIAPGLLAASRRALASMVKLVASESFFGGK